MTSTLSSYNFVPMAGSIDNVAAYVIKPPLNVALAVTSAKVNDVDDNTVPTILSPLVWPLLSVIRIRSPVVKAAICPSCTHVATLDAMAIEVTMD